MYTGEHTALVSAVIPTYNRLPLLLQAIRSVKEQTYPHIEIIVADDGSTDGTADAIEKMNDPNIRVLRLPHTGLTGRNAGVAAAKGEWVCFLDSDDRWLPQKIEKQLAALKESNAECCYTDFEMEDEEGNFIPLKAGSFKAFSGRIIEQVITTEAAACVCSLMLSKQLFDKLGGYNEQAPSFFREDYEFTLRLALSAEIIALPEVLVRIREHAGRQTNADSATQAHLNTAATYKIFMCSLQDEKLRSMAGGQYRNHMRAAAKNSLRAGKPVNAMRQMMKSRIPAASKT